MEVVIGLGCVIILLIVLGVPLQPMIALALGVMGIIAIFCTLFFIVMLVILLQTHKHNAKFIRLEEGKRIGFHAVYEVDGREYHNTFPTDTFLEKLFYQKEEVTIRIRETRHRVFVFDKLTQVIIGIGLPAFAVIAALLAVGFWI